jgi:hypothetical protein
LGGVNDAFAQQLLVQEVVGGFIASRLERPILELGLCDWVRLRPGETTGFRAVFQASVLASTVVECGRELIPEVFLTVQTELGVFSQEVAEARLGLEWQIDNQWLWEASYGTVQRNPIARIFDTAIRTQFTTDLRRQWEYGRPSQRTLTDVLPGDPQEPEVPDFIPPTGDVEPTARLETQEEPPVLPEGSPAP